MKDFLAKSYKINNSYEYIKNYIRFYKEKNSIICYDNDIKNTYFFSNLKQKNNLNNFIKSRNEAKKYSFGYYKLTNNTITEEIFTVFFKIHNKSIKNKNMYLIFVGMGKIQSPELFFVNKVIDHNEIFELAFSLDKDNLFFENNLKDDDFLINYLTQWSRENGIFLFSNNEYYSYELISVNRHEDMIQFIEKNSYILSKKNNHYKKYLYNENFQKIAEVKFLYKEELKMKESKKRGKLFSNNKKVNNNSVNGKEIKKLETNLRNYRKRIILAFTLIFFILFISQKYFSDIFILDKFDYLLQLIIPISAFIIQQFWNYMKNQDILRITDWENKKYLGIDVYKNLKRKDIDKLIRENCRTQIIRQKEIFQEENELGDYDKIISKLKIIQEKVLNPQYGKPIYLESKIKIRKRKLLQILNNEEFLLYEINILTEIAHEYENSKDEGLLEEYEEKLIKFETHFQARNQLFSL